VTTTQLLRTEFEFTLPNGYVDARGDLHRQGVMRLATALDEVAPLGDPRVQANEAYLGILLLSRVLVRLGSMHPVPPEAIEGLFSGDFAYLQDLYVRMNDHGTSQVEAECPHCGGFLSVDMAGAA
jgi:hypothetical protein